jgi:hypothetical protein
MKRTFVCQPDLAEKVRFSGEDATILNNYRLAGLDKNHLAKLSPMR